jgi:hypothetical protein
VSSWALYIDDRRDGGLYVLAGYMAPTESWNRSFTPAWRKSLTQGPKSVPEFKAGDCRHGVRSFRGWNDVERTDLTRHLVSVLLQSRNRVHGLGSALLAPRMKGLKARHAIEHLSYSTCLITLVAEALKIGKRASNCSSLYIYLDQQAKVASLVSLAFAHSKELYSAGFRGALHPPAFLSSKDSPPLQAADLLAYETLKEIRSRRARPPRPVSKVLALLTGKRPHIGRFLNLDAAVPGLATYGDRIPGTDDTCLGIIYDGKGVECNRGRGLERSLNRK